MALSEDKLYSEIGKKIYKIRIGAGIKQEMLADYLELSRVSIVNIEKGRQRPSIFLLLKIADIFKVNYTELIPSNDIITNSGIDFDVPSMITHTRGISNLTTQSLKGFIKSIKTDTHNE
jgi:DNA-binding XRE family transcriptional regulator